MRSTSRSKRCSPASPSNLIRSRRTGPATSSKRSERTRCRKISKAAWKRNWILTAIVLAHPVKG